MVDTFSFPLFDYEWEQHTDNDLLSCMPSIERFSGFHDSVVISSVTQKSGACKSYPTNAEFPQLQTWQNSNTNKIFHRAMIATEP
jgi:hypothetical protein